MTDTEKGAKEDMKQEYWKKAGSILLAGALIFTAFPNISHTVYAQEETESADTIFSEEKLNDEAVEAEETSENEKTEVEEETSISEMDKIEETNDTNGFLSLPKPLAEIAEKDSVVNEIQPLANETITYDNLTITGETSNYTYSGGTLTITGNGTFSLSGDFSKLIINQNLTVTLNLNNVDLYVLYDNTVTIDENSKLTLNLIGSNTFVCHTSGGQALLMTISGDTNSNLIINSDSGSAGSLSIQKWGGLNQNCSNVNITINGGSISGIKGVTPIYGTNSWVNELIISDITYGETPSPSAVAKIGTPTYTYATEENGTYTSTAPITAGTYYVKATVSYGSESLEAIKKFEIKKADSTIFFNQGVSLNKEYNGEKLEISTDDVTKTGSTNDVSFTWKQKDGNDWTDLSSAPVNVGNYKVIVTVEEDDNYKKATAEKEFSISQTKNDWTSELSIADWTYGQTASTPTATAKYGNVVFTYSDKEDGTYTDKVPTEVGIWYVKATVEGNENYTGLEAVKEFKIDQANSTIAFKNDFSLDKIYDTKAVAVSVDDLEITGSKGKISFTYEKKVDDTWEIMQEAPTGTGTYRVTATLAGDNNYKSAVSQPLEFTIDKADTVLEFTVNDLDKVYDGKTMVAPTNQVGNSHARVLSWYQLSEDGQWKKLEKAPVDAGSYKVVASVEADDNYNGAEIEMEFEITKAQPSYTLPTDLVIKQGESLSTLGLPDGFTWKDDTQTANTLGAQTFKAVFTPEDTTNYQTVEVDIRVDVVPTLISVNHVPTISADDKVVTVGDKFELMKDVTASDKEDGDLTNKVKVINSHVDTSKAGTYEVTYKVVDSQGASVTKTITVTVKEKTDSQTSNNGSGGTDQTNQNDKTQTAIQTDDYTNIYVWSVLSILSALGIVWTVMFKRRKKDNKTI